MFPIYKKEINQFFSSLTGYLAIGVFLLLMGLFLFIFPDTSIFDYGYATLDKFFELAPWVLLLLVPAITMRSFADEFKSGTWELLKTKPISLKQIIAGKYFSALTVAILALIPTLVYVVTIKTLSINGSIDGGGIAGSYVGLLLLTAVFTAIGILCSAITSNPVVSFLLSAFVCFIAYIGFGAVSKIPIFQGGADYWIETIGVDAHYHNMSRGLLELKDVFYFIVIICLFLMLTLRSIAKR
jgi:ABC-2 type transport system permease protein